MCHEGDVRSIDEQNDSKCQNYNKTVPVTFNLCTTLYQASGANRTFSHNANNSVCCNVHRYYVYTIAYWRIRRRPTDSTGPEGCTYMKNMITRWQNSCSRRSRNRVAWASTLIADKHSPKEENHRNKKSSLRKLYSLLYMLPAWALSTIFTPSFSTRTIIFCS